MTKDRSKQGQSRRRFLATSAGSAAVGIGAGSAAEVLLAQSAAPGVPDETATALVNGRIHTMDNARTVVSTMTIRHNRIVAVGGSAPKAGRGVRVINLGGRTVVPGLVEPHIHIVSLGNRPGYHTILENTNSIREVQEALAARRKDVPEGAWITSMGGWIPNQWAERRQPTLAELDAAVPDRPVLLYERFTGPAVTNSPGKKFFDAADAATPLHPEIRKINVAANGSIAAAGFAGGGPAASALFLLRRMQTFADKKRSTLDAMRYSASVGLTSNLDQVLFPTPGPLHPNQILSNLDQYRMYDAWLELHREGRTIVRLQTNFLQNQSDPALPELKERLRNQFQFFGDDMVSWPFAGRFAGLRRSPVARHVGSGAPEACGSGGTAQAQRERTKTWPVCGRWVKISWEAVNRGDQLSPGCAGSSTSCPRGQRGSFSAA